MHAQDVCVPAKQPLTVNFDNMKFIELGQDLKIKNFENIDLGQTFDCGQCFRWQKTTGGYTGIFKGNELTISQNENEIIIKNTNINDFKKIWCEYFDFETDYKKIGENISTLHPILKKAYKECSGIRILKQEPWETLCSFIISQNNNIPRIKKIIKSLCDLFGNKIENSEEKSFPSAQIISKLSLEDLTPIKSGFRAKYILDAAQKVDSDIVNFEKIKDMDYSKAKNTLMKIKGVGPKVADCVLLYGFHKLEAFPEDVWIKKVMNTFFKNESPKIFGKYAGIAQQYLYHYSRMHPEILE